MIADAEKALREADGPVDKGARRRSWVRLKKDGRADEGPEDHLRQIPEFVPQSPNKQQLDQFFKFILYNFLSHGIEIQLPSTKRIASWMSYISEIQDTIPRVLTCLWKDLLQKTANLVLQSWSNSASRELMRRSLKYRRIQCTTQKKLFFVGARKWNDIPACESFKGDSLSAEISKLVMKWVRRHDQDERETDGAVH